MRHVLVMGLAALALAVPAGAAKPVDVVAEFTRGEAGWPALVADYRKGAPRDAEIVQILAKQLEPIWTKSNMANSYGPLRMEIQKRLEYNDKMKERDKAAGRMLLYRACEQLDKNMADTVPPFIYGWIKPELG